MRKPFQRRWVEVVIGAAVSVFASSPSPADGVLTNQFFTGLPLGMLHCGWHSHQDVAEVTRDDMSLYGHGETLPSPASFRTRQWLFQKEYRLTNFGAMAVTTWSSVPTIRSGAKDPGGSSHHGSTNGRRFPWRAVGGGAERRPWTTRCLVCAGSMTSSISK
jgi:hypothetical protein